MKFLCDVYISIKLAKYLNSKGFESIHINQILNKWETKDHEICKYADENDFVVITKDIDFRNSFFVNKTPKKLIRIKLGNISNTGLINIIETNLTLISKQSHKNQFLIEIDKSEILLF